MPDHSISAELLPKSCRLYSDLPYGGDSPSQILDLWVPRDAADPLPLILFFHGGGFRNGGKRENSSRPVLRAVERGYAVADVEYRRSGEAQFPAMLLDAKAAVRFLRASAAEYGLDPTRFAAWGPSSGGWLVSMLALTAGTAAFGAPDGGDGVQAVVDWCGPCGGFDRMDGDFSPDITPEQSHSTPDSMESLFLGRPVSESPELCGRACPIAYVSADVPPFLILHGRQDPVVPLAQSLRFRDALLAAGAAAELHILEEMGHHGKPWDDDGTVDGLTYAFLDRILKQTEKTEK